ncbi:hypothetical protein ACH5RR_035972 [Cinchona calisaya]|uniref:RING-type E3 ubiquitin transferase n=1 Tax=Cinchona calisaya TaxID=153742 RepID=A0ABD2Y216_9GENT
MGAVCCCFTVPDIDDHGHENNLSHGNCLFLNYCMQNINNENWTSSLHQQYGALFARGDGLPVPASNQEATSSDSVVPHNTSSDARSSERILLMNSSSGYSPMPQDVVVRRQDKGSNHSRVEPEPVNDHEVQLTPRPSEVEDKLINANSQGESKECCSESSMKVLSSSMLKEVGYDVSASEDDDVCPTCLEEYTPQNPKIITQCFHHYHLSCIYEWMERSESCPVCGKLMEFKETT